MTGGRQSDFALTVKGTGILHLHDDNRFSGGTSIVDGATLVVWDSLTSDVHVAGAAPGASSAPTLWLGSTVNGDVVNDGVVSLQQLCGTGIDQCVETRHPVINGDFRQSAAGELQATLGVGLQITGSATVDGKLLFLGSSALNYVLPTAPASILVLHANGSVSGKFAQWRSDALLLAGSLRYLASDVYFDATAISAAQAMATAQATDAITLQSAAHFDAALGDATKWAQLPHDSLTVAQQHFLASVGAIQRLQDYDQATRTFDSLSGHGYADAADALLQQVAIPAPELMARVSELSVGRRSGAWSAQTAMLASGSGAFSSERSGFDQWLGDRTLLGASFGWTDGNLRFDRTGGSARDQSPQWDVYVRHNVDGNAYLFGDVGYGRHQLDLNRLVDLGSARRAAGARPDIDLLHAYLEAGHDFRVGQGRLTPFGGLSYAMLRGAGFAEQGSTGFELVVQPYTYQRVNAVAGIRLSTDWYSESGRRMKWNLTAGYRHLLDAHDSARAAFTGTPDVTFVLAGLPNQRNTGWLQTGLATSGVHWNWMFNYDRQAGDQALSLGTTYRF